jgi:hypothetical protein
MTKVAVSTQFSVFFQWKPKINPICPSLPHFYIAFTYCELFVAMNKVSVKYQPINQSIVLNIAEILLDGRKQ